MATPFPDTGWLAWGWYVPRTMPERAGWVNVNADEGVELFTDIHALADALEPYDPVQIWEVDLIDGRPVRIADVTADFKEAA